MVEAEVVHPPKMEHVLDLYARSENPEDLVVNMDETTRQLTREGIEPLPPVPGKAMRYDTLYKRNGVTVLFLFFDALRGWKQVNIAEGKIRKDWALQAKELLDMHYPHAKKVHLVMDNLNTNDRALLYEALSPEEAHRSLSRLEFQYTSKHGSWLNIAEIELSAMALQCLTRRILYL